MLITLATSCSTSSDRPLHSRLTDSSALGDDSEAAINNARLSASHLILDGVVQSASAQPTTFSEGLSIAGLTNPLVSPFSPASETPVWLVYLTGLFYEPQGPPGPGVSSQPPQEPSCSRITVILDSDTYNSSC